MKQKIVLKVNMSENEKSRKKAMKIASGASGVSSVSVQGQNDQLVLLGEDIDTAGLTRELCKKIGHTSILTVQAAPQSQQQQQQSQSQVIKCICEIPHSGYCGFCKSMNQYHYQVVPHQTYAPPVNYGYGSYYRAEEDPNACIVM